MLSPEFSEGGARYLRESFPGLSGLGLDALSLACIDQSEVGLEVYRVLLPGPERRFLIVEDRDLDHDLSRLRHVMMLP